MSALTKEQELKVEEIVQETLRNGIRCGRPLPLENYRKYVDKIYKDYYDSKPPENIIETKGPLETCEIYKKSYPDSDPTSKIDYLNTCPDWIKYYHTGVHLLGEKIGEDEEALLLQRLLDDANEFTSVIHGILCAKNTCFLFWPKKICIKNDDLEEFHLHNPDGLAIEYEDGSGLAYIDDIHVPDYIALTPAEKLDIVQVLKEADIDVRRIGLAKITSVNSDALSKVSTIIDSMEGENAWEKYQLLSLDFGDTKKRIALRMYDVASGEWCVERVSDECTTVAQALAFRDDEDIFIPSLIQT